MPRRRTLRRLSGLAAALAVAGTVAALSARSAEPASRERELARLRSEIASLSERLRSVEERKLDLAGRLAHSDLLLELQESRAAEAVAARELAATRVRAVEESLARLEADLAGARGDLRRRLAGLYRLGQQGYLRLLLAAEPEADALSAVRMVRFLAHRDRQAIDRYQTLSGEVATERDALLAEQRRVEEWTASEQQRRRELVAQRRRQSELLAAADGERRRLSASTAELEGRERRLTSLLAGLAGRTLVPLSGTPMQQFQGVLDWPTPGEVVVGFGPRLDPRYRTRVPHNGIELATRPGAKVHAIYPGTVLFASPFQSFGLTAVVHHPGRVFTLYAGLESLQVEKDDVLSLGQPVGAAADRLYFEIRVENRPQDPLKWLR